MSVTGYYIDPNRPKPRFAPFKAMGHMNKLLADKEDTAQVFHIIEALNGNAMRKQFMRSLATPEGQARLAERRDLAPLLDDHDAFGVLPAGSVGRAYIDFMKREGLTAEGLVKESQILRGNGTQYNDDLEWFTNRQRDTHDMFHVLSGYGRDGLGEAALLAFTHGQSGGRGILFISIMAFRQMRKQLGRSLDLRAVYKEGRAHGKLAAKISDQDILALMHEPLREARIRLNIKEPVAYKAALKAFAELPADERAMLAA